MRTYLRYLWIIISNQLDKSVDDEKEQKAVDYEREQRTRQSFLLILTPKVQLDVFSERVKWLQEVCHSQNFFKLLS